MPAGRPTKYDESINGLVYNYCLLGATDKQLADFLDISEATLNNWKNDYPKLLESIKNGKERADAEVAQSLFHRAKGYSHKEDKIFNNNGEIVRAETIKHYPPDATSAIFWLKNRQKANWRDKQEHEHTGADGEPIKIDNEVTINLVSASEN